MVLFKKTYLLIWLIWLLVAARGVFVEMHGLSSLWELCTGSVDVGHGPSCSVVVGSQLPNQGLNLRPLHCKAGSPSLDHQEGPHGSLFVSLIAWIIEKKRRSLGSTAAPPFLALQLQAISAELRSPQSFRPFKLVRFTVSGSLSPAWGGWTPSNNPFSKLDFFSCGGHGGIHPEIFV